MSMQENAFGFDTLKIAEEQDCSRITEIARGDYLPKPALSPGFEERFTWENLLADITSHKRIIVLLERKRSEITWIIELFQSVQEPTLYYSRTLPQWGRATTLILPKVLEESGIPCTKIAIPYIEKSSLFSAFSSYRRQVLNTLEGLTIEMLVSPVIQKNDGDDEPQTGLTIVG